MINFLFGGLRPLRSFIRSAQDFVSRFTHSPSFGLPYLLPALLSHFLVKKNEEEDKGDPPHMPGLSMRSLPSLSEPRYLRRLLPAIC